MFEAREGIDYINNFFRKARYDKNKDLFLLTTDDGSHIFVNKFVLREIKRGKISNKDTFNKLENRNIILTKENIKDTVSKTSKRYQFLNNGTSLHILIPTSRCNLGCKYCFASPQAVWESKEEYDLDETTVKKIVDFIFTSPSKAITIEITGGEALVNYENILVMADHANELNKKYKKDLKLALVTNLTLANDEIINKLIDKGVTFCTSLDGPKELHNKNRIIRLKNNEKEIGTYDLVVKWIKRINEIYKERGIKSKVGAIQTITSTSLPYYKEIIDEYANLGIDMIDIRPMTMVGKAVDEESNYLRFDFKDFEKFYSNSLKYIREKEKDGFKMTERMKNLYELKILKNTPGYHTDFESPCGATTGQLTYHSNGDIYTCHEALGRDEFKLGSVFLDTWDTIFKKQETSKAILNSMLESNVKCDRCVFKPYCGTCMVENYYNFDKFNFYPTKTQKHHETIMQAKRVFDELLKLQGF